MGSGIITTIMPLGEVVINCDDVSDTKENLANLKVGFALSHFLFSR